MMDSRKMTVLATALGVLAAAPAMAGGEAVAPAGAAAPRSVEEAVRTRDARLAEVERLAAEMARLAQAQAARAAEQARFELRLAAADDAAEAESARRAREEASREAETEAQLREAEKRLEEAAREIAELTAQIVGEVAPAVVEGVSQGMRRAMLGVNVKNLGDSDDKAEGVLVVGVTPGWPADEAGIRNGDVLVAVGGKKLDWADGSSPMEKLVSTLGDVEAGETVKVEYRRDGEARTAEVPTRTFGDAMAFAFGDPGTVHEYRFAPQPGMPGMPHVEKDVRILRNRIIDKWGDMELVELTPGLGDYFGTDEGVLVVRAPKDETLGLKDGDVILDIGGRKPVDPGHVIRILRSYEPGETLAMTIVRRKKRESISVEVPSARVPEAPAPVPAPTRVPAPEAPKPVPLKT